MERVAVLRCGVVEYHVIFELMKDLQKKRIAGEIEDTLIFVQHPEVVTIGPKAVREESRLKAIQLLRPIGEEE